MTKVTSRIERLALGTVDAVFVENEAMLRHVRTLSRAYVTKASPGIDTSLFCPPAAGWNRHGHILSVCRLSDPRKGIDRTIRAYAELVQARADAPDLVLAGRGSLPAPVAALAAEMGLASRVIVRPDVKPDELVDLYRGASVFLQTSFEEGLGLSVLEAMACGLPVVATETAGSIETVVHGVTGWRVPQGPESDVPHMLAHRMAMLLDDAGPAFGSRGRDRCRSTFSSGVTVARFTDVYDALRRGNRPAAAHELAQRGRRR
jgi:glycosyltransferase involved in cell wall biosynthesis